MKQTGSITGCLYCVRAFESLAIGLFAVFSLLNERAAEAFYERAQTLRSLYAHGWVPMLNVHIVRGPRGNG